MIKLPISINKHKFRFLSHPAADVIRNRISEYQAFSSKYEADDLHTFYIFFFLEKKVHGLPKILDDLYESFGVRTGVESDYFRPSLWQLYESVYPGYFLLSNAFFVSGRSTIVRPNRRHFLSNLKLYRTTAKGKQTDYELH